MLQLQSTFKAYSTNSTLFKSLTLSEYYSILANTDPRVQDFVGELEYWGLSALYLEPCCAYTLQRASWLLPVADHEMNKDNQASSVNKRKWEMMHK